MKRILAIAIAALALCSCGIMNPQDDAKVAAQVESALKKGDFVIDITSIRPQTGVTRRSLGEYTFAIKDGKVRTRLPFFGVSNTGSFGSSDLSIVFEDVPVDIREITGSRGQKVLSFSAKSGDFNYTVTVQIYRNGHATINCMCTQRSMMDYDGDLILE